MWDCASGGQRADAETSPCPFGHWVSRASRDVASTTISRVGQSHCPDRDMVIPYLMARMTVRSTFALDPETADSLDRLAKRWQVSKSEALRRAVAAAATVEEADAASDSLNALSELQERLGLDVEKAEKWARSVRAEREAGRA